MIDLQKLKQESTGKWVDIYQRLGIDIPANGKHGACPACGGSDRFRMDDKDGMGTYFCSQCGAGDGFKLVQKVLGVDFKEAMSSVNDLVGSCVAGKVQEEKKITPEELNKIFSESKPIGDGHIVRTYLSKRGLKTFPNVLREHPALYEPETGKKMPAMIAIFTKPEGQNVTIHQTFLTKDGLKGNTKTQKRIKPSLEKMSGGAVRLFDIEQGALGIAEGIETAIACTEKFYVPTWASLTANLMENFQPPPEVKKLFIFADNDSNFTGQRVAYSLANRLMIKGNIEVSVVVPRETGFDFLDEITAAKNR